MKKIDDDYKLLVDGIIGTRNSIKYLLITKGFSEITTNEIIAKTEVLIGLSGQLGRLLQRDKDYIELRKMHLQLDQFKKRGGCVD